MVSPTVLFKTPNLYLQAGIIPSWERGNFNMLPNAMADITTNDQRFTIQLGWIGYYNKRVLPAVCIDQSMVITA